MSAITAGRSQNVDAVVIGAGFAGLYMAHQLRHLGMTFRAFEAGSGVGGTWYWNRYPGAGSDSESWVYSFSFSADLEKEWTWSSRFPRQPEILRYLEFAAERLDLQAAFDFNTRVIGARYDDADNSWAIETDRGETVKAKFLITAVGCLSAAQVPDIPGRESFAGPQFHTAQWPHEPVNFSGKRVGVIGTGSSGIQAIPVIAEQAGHLTVFQRTPNFSIPARNRKLTPEEQESLKRDITEIREFCRWATIGQPYDFKDASALEVTDEERRRVFEANWEKGGFEWMFGSYKDLLSDRRANDMAADFVREKIRSVIKDPEIARKLIPTDYPIGTKRLPLDIDYFETFNRDNVTLVDLRETPIEWIVAEGVRTSDGVHALDMLVFATGFDALTGPLFRIGLRGRDGVRLQDKWAEGPSTYLGIATQDFPNLFMITGPGSPSVLGNMPTSIEQNVEWISQLLVHMRATGATRIEPTAAAEQQWRAHVKELADDTLFPQANSWYVGDNIPGKPRVFLPYIGGFGTYRKLCDEIAEKGYEGFAFS